jgi:hypothetical protein
VQTWQCCKSKEYFPWDGARVVCESHSKFNAADRGFVRGIDAGEVVVHQGGTVETEACYFI